MTAIRDVVDPKDVQVTIRGLLPDRIRGYAREKVAREINRHDGRVLGTHIVITQSNDPAVQRPCTVEVGVDLSGRPVRAQVAASGATEAVDLAVDRLQRRLATARAEIAAFVEYDYVVVNDELEACVERLQGAELRIEELARQPGLEEVVLQVRVELAAFVGPIGGRNDLLVRELFGRPH